VCRKFPVYIAPMMKLSRGALRLELFLRDSPMSKRAFAQECGVSERALYNWLKGRNVPDVRSAVRIEEHTSGDVPVRAWAQ
jgi:transcriptional regulator with XRE-family HTH domain